MILHDKQSNTEKNQIAIITGMTGVGKDYLVEKANINSQITTIGWGDLLGEELAADKDFMMKSVESERIKAGQFAVCRTVLEIQPLLAICHVVKPEAGSYVYNLEIEKLLNPLYYIFVVAPGDIIDQRVRQRNKDGARKSPEIPAEEIDRIQKIKLEAVKELAKIQNTEMIILNNIDEELDSNLVELRQVIEILKTKKEHHG